MTLTVADLAGYVERHLDADLARWFPDAERVSVGADARPVAPFLGRLPAASAVEADFLALGQDGALDPDVGMLRYMK